MATRIKRDDSKNGRRRFPDYAVMLGAGAPAKAERLPIMHDHPNANVVRDGVEERRILPVDKTSSKTILIAVAVAVAAAVFAVDMSLPLGVAGGVP